MAGYQTIEALRPILHRGPPATPVVDRALVGRTDDLRRIVKRRVGKPGVRLPPALISEIIARRERGDTYNKISAELGVSQSRIWVYAGHVKPPNGRWLNGYETGARKIIPRNKPFAERLRRAGFSYREIGEEIGCSMSDARRLLLGFRCPTRKRSRISDTIKRVERASGIPSRDIKKTSLGYSCRAADLTKARHICFWLIRTFQPNLSFPDIGFSMGGFHHTSVLHGYRKVDRVVRAFGISADGRPQDIARALWKADWREVGK